MLKFQCIIYFTLINKKWEKRKKSTRKKKISSSPDLEGERTNALSLCVGGMKAYGSVDAGRRRIEENGG